MLRGPCKHVVDRFERTGLKFDLDSTSFDKESDAAGVRIVVRFEGTLEVGDGRLVSSFFRQ